jgi:hypothetical protein
MADYRPWVATDNRPWVATDHSRRWSGERMTALRSSAADIRNRATELGQWRRAHECSHFYETQDTEPQPRIEIA